MKPDMKADTESDARTRVVSKRSALASACAALLTATLATPAAAAPNLLRGGDFEGVEGRSFWHSSGGDVVNAPRPGAAGGSVFRVTTTDPRWRMGRQKVALPEGAKSMRLSGWARTEGVKPPPDAEWRRAQMQIGYHDAGGELVGQWNDIDLPLGRSPWTFYKSDFPVPAGARTLIVFLGNNNVSGTSCFDDVRVEPLDADGGGLGDVVGEAKFAGVATVVHDAPPVGPADTEGAIAADGSVTVETDTGPEGDPGDYDSEDPVGIGAFAQAMIGGGAVLVMMVIFALVARGRSEQSSDG